MLNFNRLVGQYMSIPHIILHIFVYYKIFHVFFLKN